jgi:predicted HAD superfamily Cof-like phosphohydrolase
MKRNEVLINSSLLLTSLFVHLLYHKPSETTTRSYCPEALTHARFHTKSKVNMGKAKDTADKKMISIQLVRQRHKATRKASEKVRALTAVATAPTNLPLIDNGADVSQTTHLTFLTQPRGEETDHVERINDIDSSIVEFDYD